MTGTSEKKPLMTPVFESTVCPWTPENPRHDHQLIFHLDDARLMLVWSEYYANAPRLVSRNQFASAAKDRGFVDDAPCRISAKISEDAGRSWSPKFTLQENRWGRNVKHPNLIRLKDGGVLFTFTAWESEVERNVFMKKSDDNCETWGPVRQISDPGWYCTNNDHALRLSSGRIVLPAHGGPGLRYESAKTKLHSFVFYSDDEGENWRMSDDAFTAPGRGAHEPTIVELEDGRLLCLMRTTNGCVYRNYSEDQGVHWSRPEPTELEAPDSPPLMKYLPDSQDIILLWNNVASHSNWPRTPLTCAVSRDAGESWTKFRDIDNREDHDAAYAGLTFHGDEALVTYYTRGTYWTRDTEIILKVYNVDQFYE